MGPALKALLPKLGLGATTARELVHAVQRYGGPDITNIYTAAGTMRIKMFIGHWRKNDATSDILRISLGCCQQEVGIGSALLSQDYRKYGWILQDCWIKMLWSFLDDINGTIVIEDDWQQKRLENDQFLMKIIHDMALSRDQIRQINQCCLYKNITYLSEILNHDFQSFHPDLWEPNKKLESNVTKRFPIIEVPRQYWDPWKNVITAVRSNNIITINSFGKLHDKSSSRWLVSKDYRYIYKKCESQYSVHRRKSQNKNGHVYDIEPIFLTNVTVYEFLEYVTLTVTASNIQIKSTRIQEPKARSTFTHHLPTLSEKATVPYALL